MALRACPPSLPITYCGSHLPGCLQVAPALCSCSRRRGFERADSEYTDKLQHYTSGHSTYTPWGPSLPSPWRPLQLLLLLLLLQDLFVFKYVCVCMSVCVLHERVSHGELGCGGVYTYLCPHRGHHIPWNCSYRCLWDTWLVTWVLGSELRSS